MPEPYWPKRKGSYTLRAGAKNARHIELKCNYCKRTRYLVIDDLIALLGNIEIDDVGYAGFRCDKCQGTIFDVDLKDPRPGSGAVIKRLVRIDYVRRPVWHEEQV